MSDPITDLKRELLAAAERQQEHGVLGSAGVARKSRRRWLERSHLEQGGRRRRLVVLAAVALVAIVGTASAFAMRASREKTSTRTGLSVSVSGVPKVDYMINLNTGVMTPLPKAIIRSLSKADENVLGGRPLPRHAASPNGSRLAYVGTGNQGRPQIFIANINGTGVRQMTHDPRGATSPAWSPDGTKIAFVGTGSGKVRNLFVLDVTTRKTTPIAAAGRVPPWAQPTFKPDGALLVYSGGSDQVPVLLTVPVAGGKSTLLFGRNRGGMADAANGSMSPDGSLITMMGSKIGGPGAIRFVANADGELRSIPGRESNPAGTWSPDGHRIVCSDGASIIVFDVATGKTSRVTKGSSAIWLNRHTLLVQA